MVASSKSAARTLPRSPQGRPAFAQEGSSGPGIELAGKSADLVFTAQPDVPGGRRFRDSIRAAARRHGRDPSSVLALPGIAFVIGSTEAEAKAARAGLEFRVDPEFRWRNLAHNAGLDPALIDPDRPLSPEAAATAQRLHRSEYSSSTLRGHLGAGLGAGCDPEMRGRRTA